MRKDGNTALMERPMDDPRPVTLGDFREFKDEFRRELSELRTSVKSLELGQSALGLQFANSRTESLEKTSAAERQHLMALAAAEKEQILNQAKESGRIDRLDTKTGLLWAAGGVILMLVAKMVFDLITKK